MHINNHYTVPNQVSSKKPGGLHVSLNCFQLCPSRGRTCHFPHILNILAIENDSRSVTVVNSSYLQEGGIALIDLFQSIITKAQKETAV